MPILPDTGGRRMPGGSENVPPGIFMQNRDKSLKKTA